MMPGWIWLSSMTETGTVITQGWIGSWIWLFISPMETHFAAPTCQMCGHDQVAWQCWWSIPLDHWGQNESRVLRPHVAQRLLLGLDGKVSEELLLLLSLPFSWRRIATTKAATVVVSYSLSRALPPRYCLESTLGFQDQNQVIHVIFLRIKTLKSD